MTKDDKPTRLPPWLREAMRVHGDTHELKKRLRKGRLNTVCESARCPNLAKCFARPTATFLLMGNRCTRGCTFCAVESAVPGALDPNEPLEVARAAAEMELKFVVLTSVTRDDLPDGGAAHFAAAVRAVKQALPAAKVEVLVPDFQGDESAIETVLESRPDVFNHNVETVPRLYPEVRPRAAYPRSLSVLETAKRMQPGTITKSGLMVGLGESRDEVLSVMRDLRGAGCDVLTIGQYLRPRKTNHPVMEYIRPDAFDALAEDGRRMGFAEVFAGPLVRSSFFAETVFERARENERERES